MKQAIAITAVVAILGIIGLAATKTKASGNPSPVNSTEIQQPSPLSATTTSQSSPSNVVNANYKDGSYTGSAVDNPFGTVQVAAVISGGKITNIKFLQMPSDMGHSRMVTQVSSPILKSETITAQSANIDFVSGATITSESYDRSLQAALNQAVNS